MFGIEPTGGGTMPVASQNIHLSSHVNLVLFHFTRGQHGGNPPSDRKIQEFAEEMRLVPVSTVDVTTLIQEFPQYQRPEHPIVFYGSRGRGPSDRGGFAGHQVLETSGEVKVAMDWTRPESGEWDWETHFLMKSEAPLADWTADEKGASNSSEKYYEIVGVVEETIQNSGHDIVRGRLNAVARVIVSKLAHEYGLAPREKKAKKPS